MAEHHEVEEPDVQPALPRTERSTAPQSEFTMRQVGTGIVVLAVGLVLTFGVALAV